MNAQHRTNLLENRRRRIVRRVGELQAQIHNEKIRAAKHGGMADIAAPLAHVERLNVRFAQLKNA